jgi:hypothetical protein
MNTLLAVWICSVVSAPADAKAFLEKYFKAPVAVSGRFTITTTYDEKWYARFEKDLKAKHPDGNIEVSPSNQFIDCDWLHTSDKEYYFCSRQSNMFTSFFKTKDLLITQADSKQLSVQLTPYRPGDINPGDFYLYLGNQRSVDVIAKAQWKQETIGNDTLYTSTAIDNRLFKLTFGQEGKLKAVNTYRTAPNSERLVTALTIEKYIPSTTGELYPAEATLRLFDDAGGTIWMKRLKAEAVAFGEEPAIKLSKSAAFTIKEETNVHHLKSDRATYLKSDVHIQDIFDGKIEYDQKVNEPPSK